MHIKSKTPQRQRLREAERKRERVRRARESAAKVLARECFTTFS